MSLTNQEFHLRLRWHRWQRYEGLCKTHSWTQKFVSPWAKAATLSCKVLCSEDAPWRDGSVVPTKLTEPMILTHIHTKVKTNILCKSESWKCLGSGKSACNYPFLVRGAVFKASDVGLSNLCVELGHRPNTSNRQTELETAENTIICCT